MCDLLVLKTIQITLAKGLEGASLVSGDELNIVLKNSVYEQDLLLQNYPYKPTTLPLSHGF